MNCSGKKGRGEHQIFELVGLGGEGKRVGPRKFGFQIAGEQHQRQDMKLFHFCAPQFLEGIKAEGLTLGMTPIARGEGIVFIPQQQWLTSNPSFDQSWNARVMVKYDRAAYRIEVSIPQEHRN